MLESAYHCTFSVTSKDQGFIGSYDIMDGAGEVVEVWESKSALPTMALAMTCARNRANAAIRSLSECTVCPGP